MDEPRSLRVGRRLSIDVLDNLLRDRRVHIPAMVAVVRMDRCRVAEQVARLPLTRIAADEPVEVVVALPDWPVGERPGGRSFPDRDVVIFAEPCRGITIFLQGHRHVRGFGWNYGVVTG